MKTSKDKDDSSSSSTKHSPRRNNELASIVALGQAEANKRWEQFLQLRQVEIEEAKLQREAAQKEREEDRKDLYKLIAALAKH